MKTKLVAIFLCVTLPGFAHRLDEYLQATMVSVEKDRLHASMRLVPGVAVSSLILASIDTNRDGVVSEAEGQAYAHQVLRDLSLTLDGHPLAPRLVSANFPAVQEMKEGLGEIRIEFIADLPRGGINRKLIIENRHQSRISAYLVNCLLPHDRDIRVIAQDRNANQSLYQLNYIQANGSAKPLPSRWWSRAGDSLNALGGFESMFRLGMRHIAEGTDHSCFCSRCFYPRRYFPSVPAGPDSPACGKVWRGY